MIGALLALSMVFGYSPVFDFIAVTQELSAITKRSDSLLLKVAETKLLPKSGSVVPKTPAGNSLAPLTADECKDLGGQVLSSSGVCLSNFMCKAKGESGVAHLVCITKK